MSEVELVVTLRIMGELADPEQISRMLGRPADEGHTKGSPRPGPRQSPFSEGLWSMTLEDRAPDELLNELLSFCLARESSLRQLRSENDLRIDAFVGVFCGEGNCSFELDSRVLEGLGRMGIPIGLDIYCDFD